MARDCGSSLDRWCTLVDQLRSAAVHGVLLIDDADDLFGADGLAHLVYLLRNRPPHLGVAIATRGALTLPLSRYVLADELILLSPEDLAFRLPEIEQYLKQTRGASAERARMLLEETGGWPALLHLAQRADLHTDTTVRQHLVQLARDEILPSLAAAEADFLKSIAVLPELDVAMACALTGVKHAGRILRRLAEHGLAAESRPGSYRIPTLLRSAIMQVFGEEDAPGLRNNYLRALNELSSQLRAADALRLAAEAGSAEKIVDLLGEHGWTLLRRRGHSELLKALSVLDEDRIVRAPRLAVLRAWCHVFVGDIDRVAAFLRHAPDEHAQLGDPWIGQHLRALQRAVSARTDRAPEGLFDPTRLAPREGDSDFLRSLALLHIGGAWRAQNELARSIEVLRECVEVAEAGDCPFVSLSAQIGLGQALHLTGQLDESLQTYTRALSQTWPATAEEPILGALCLVRMAQLHLDRGQLDACGAALDRAESMTTPAQGARVHGLAALVRARLAFARRDWIAADHQLGVVRRVALGHDANRLLMLARLEEARLRLVAGAIEEAEKAVRAAGEIMNADAQGPAHDKAERFLATAAQTHMARGAFTHARGLLARAAATAQAAGRFSHLLLIDTLTAVCWLQEGSESRALQAFEVSFQRARREGFRQLFLDLGMTVPIVRLLQVVERKWRRVTCLAEDRAYVASLAEECGSQPARPATIDSLAPVKEKFSRKDALILFYLSRGLKNAEIADQLGLSVETVRWRLKQLYSKLGARTRTEALARARLLALVD